MNDLHNAQQKDLVVDILEIYFVEHVKRVPDLGALDDYFTGICEFAINNGDVKRAQGVVERIIGFSNNKEMKLSYLLAKSFEDEGLYSKAYKFYVKCKDENRMMYCMDQVIK
eukprot:CAMPEP_0176374490 /NCGR_PEP_ID=MMETSP0126-20121128/26792_1 /TAXON_ID=141414 ORGANISM="Strombidinopsis acuminatum, Strain SPMC142" /NCGR_SAMPLE_ID=MMETSP0126 /ASSEMBLY_ACC=CAM_ASM_000229 /LENGTH=111 /DNA_ID=CAMNT_0017735083 /DNA_START=143 /DNA_END=478 /DNA_ORIENTATION=-